MKQGHIFSITFRGKKKKGSYLRNKAGEIKDHKNESYNPVIGYDIDSFFFLPWKDVAFKWNLKTKII